MDKMITQFFWQRWMNKKCFAEAGRFSCDTNYRNMTDLRSQTIVSLEKWPKLVENKGLYSLLLQFIRVHLSGSY